jgi:hypothetical protein
VQPHADAARRKPHCDGVARRQAHGEQVVDARGRRPLLEQADGAREPLAIDRRVPAPGRIGGRQTRQLDAQERGLQTVEPLIGARKHMLALAALPEVAQLADAVRHVGVVRADGAAVTERSEVLARIEGEGGADPEPAGRTALVRRSVRLRGVLEERDAVPRGKAPQRPHVAELAVQVHGHDGRGAWADRGAGRRRVDEAGALLHIAQDGHCTGVDDGESRRDVRAGRHDDLVAAADSGCAEQQRERGRARGGADAVCGATGPRPRCFEGHDFVAEDERAALDHALERRTQLARHLGVLAVEGDERDGRGSLESR